MPDPRSEDGPGGIPVIDAARDNVKPKGQSVAVTGTEREVTEWMCSA